MSFFYEMYTLFKVFYFQNDFRSRKLWDKSKFDREIIKNDLSFNSFWD